MNAPGTPPQVGKPSHGGGRETVTVVIGYGRTGASAITALTSDATGFSGPVVVLERRPDRVAAASAAGLSVVAGDATDADVLHRAGVPGADCVLITCMDNATTTVVLARVRRLSDSAKVVVAARKPENIAALHHAGADLVVAASRIIGGLLALTATGMHTAHAALLLLTDGLRQRQPRPQEVGTPVPRCEPMVLAVLRDGTRHWSNDPTLGAVRPDDVLIGWAE